ncbi:MULTISPECIES: hypothetical protein [Weissella]|uniref:Uncharacterized protein n=1 Tax=Weissella fermenti TaxID=2987699 RepID=A0ABT6D5N9_9LACO|nr:MULTISPECIES: hypothetical protein [Weissella]MCW0927866.1 hypothetical protein [Weissella sp. LMG 11983]MDF9300835.1 hypothetical protein [Weissella sp. BK2]
MLLSSIVTEFAVGDRVFARPDMDATGKFGSYATFMAVNVDKVAAMPDNMTFAEAAALPLAGETALQMLRELRVTDGSKVLVFCVHLYQNRDEAYDDKYYENNYNDCQFHHTSYHRSQTF